MDICPDNSSGNPQVTVYLLNLSLCKNENEILYRKWIIIWLSWSSNILQCFFVILQKFENQDQNVREVKQSRIFIFIFNLCCKIVENRKFFQGMLPKIHNSTCSFYENMYQVMLKTKTFLNMLMRAYNFNKNKITRSLTELKQKVVFH